MQLKALHAISLSGRRIWAGDVFDCDDYEVVQYLIQQAAAEPIEPISASGEGVPVGLENIPAEVGTGPGPAGWTAETVVKRQDQVSEPQATTDPCVTIPAGDPETLNDPAKWTKDQIKEALDRLGVAYDGRVGKAKLLKLLQGAL